MSGKSIYLLDERSLGFQPSLARLIGVNAAIVCQEMAYFGSEKRWGRTLDDGERWIFNTYEEWKERFPFWSTKTIQRIFEDLESRRIVISCQPEGRSSRRKYYRFDPSFLHLLDSGRIEELAESNHPEEDKLTSSEQVMLSFSEQDTLSSSSNALSTSKVHSPNGSGKPSLKVAKPTSDPRHVEFREAYVAAYLAHTGSSYPFHAKDAKHLASLLKSQPALTLEVFIDALNWCRRVAANDPRAMGFVRKTGSLGDFCLNWGQIVEYSQSYHAPQNNRR